MSAHKLMLVLVFLALNLGLGHAATEEPGVSGERVAVVSFQTGNDQQVHYSPELAKMALHMEVEANAFQWRDVNTMTPAASVLVEIINKSDHAIPDVRLFPGRVVLYVTAKTLDGNVFYANEKIYIRSPQQLNQKSCEESSLLYDSAFWPRTTTKESFMIPVYTESEEDGKVVRAQLTQNFTVDVEAWYLPNGKKDGSDSAQKWFAVSKMLHLPADGK